jgi:hypothetical protein
MNGDQRPGRVRVFSSSAGAAPNPGRRRSDRVEVEEAPEVLAPPTPVATATGKGYVFLLVGLFLLGCVIGGALMAWSGLMPGAPR